MNEEDIKKLIQDSLKSNMKTLQENVQKAWADFKSEHQTDIKKSFHDCLADAKMDKINDVIADNQTKLQNMQIALQKLDAIISRNGAGEEGTKTDEQKKRQDIFFKSLRFGKERLSAEESKALASDDQSAGGFLVLPDFEKTLLRNITEITPIRQLASVRQIMGPHLEVPRRTSGSAASWTGERTAYTESTNPAYGMLQIAAHEMKCQISTTQTLLDDAMFNIEQMISEEGAEAFAVAEATAFCTGNGTTQPYGIASYANGTGTDQIEQVASGSSGAFTANGLLNLVYALKDGYARAASFLIKRSSILLLRKLVDGQSRYLWAPGLTSDQPQTLLGYPLFEGTDVAAASASSLSAYFGDFKHYQIVDRMGTRILRDPYTDDPNVVFKMAKRTGGAVRIHEAFKIQILST